MIRYCFEQLFSWMRCVAAWRFSLEFFTTRKVILLVWGIIFILVLAGCNTSEEPQSSPTPANTLPPPEVLKTSIPPVQQTILDFFSAWEEEDYESMYGMFSDESQAAQSKENFVQYQEDVANQVLLTDLDFDLISAPASPSEAEVEYTIRLNSAVLGIIERRTKMRLTQQGGRWVIHWDATMILPELTNGNYLRMDRDGADRADIYDRNGNLFVTEAEAAAIGVWPGYVDLTDEDTLKGLIPLLSGLSGLRTDTVITMIQNAAPGEYLAFGEVPTNQDPRRLDLLSTWGAAVVSRYTSRLYLGSGIAPHVVGYVSSIQREEITRYRRLGYSSAEKVGRKGIEAWGEAILRGQRGGRLYVFNPEGKYVAEIGSAPSVPGKDIYTTLDLDFQREVQKALSGFSGAIVVVERDTGRVLAMASRPGFDQNAFQIENYNWATLLNRIVSDPANPQFNRASQGLYPLGSVFKLVTAAAGLQSGRFSAETTYDCKYVFEELPGFPRYDWTWERFQEDGRTPPSGLLTFSQGLTRSCNPFYWHIGLDLYNVGLTTAISGMARDFGLGSLTGIEVVEESAGVVPDPTSQVDAINLAIGQGDLQVTPLQVALFTAALGNGGTLYRPQLIEAIVDPGTAFTSTFQPQVNGSLPLSAEHLALIQEGMIGVARSLRPLGTAYPTFDQFPIKLAGKTGTASVSIGDPHSWFAGYTFEGREDKPDIAVVVIAENSGEGSQFAAPIFRRVIELYFYGRANKLYRWEANFDVTRSPTPILSPTPTGSPTP